MIVRGWEGRRWRRGDVLLLYSAADAGTTEGGGVRTGILWTSAVVSPFSLMICRAQESSDSMSRGKGRPIGIPCGRRRLAHKQLLSLHSPAPWGLCDVRASHALLPALQSIQSLTP